MKYLLKRLGIKIDIFVTDKFVPFWVKVMNFIRKLAMLLTFFSMVAGILFVVYYLFLCYDVSRVITACFFLVTMVFVNHKLQE
jgi:hypothetical protein